MEKGILGTNLVTQIGIIVKDIEASSRRFADFFGVDVPQWFETDEYGKAMTAFRGEPTEARAKLVFFNCGQLDIELIEPDGNPSTWREFLDTHGEGVHHIAFVIKGMKEKTLALEQKGFPLVQKGEYTGGRYAYIDTSHELHTIIELLENDGEQQ